MTPHDGGRPPPTPPRARLGTLRSASLEDARAELGVDGSSDGDAVRRAYLRALKLHKPGRDPEGFQRVREAYDLLRERRGM